MRFVGCIHGITEEHRVTEYRYIVVEGDRQAARGQREFGNTIDSSTADDELPFSFDDCAKNARDDVNNCRRNRVQLNQGQYRGNMHARSIIMFRGDRCLSSLVAAFPRASDVLEMRGVPQNLQC